MNHRRKNVCVWLAVMLFFLHGCAGIEDQQEPSPALLTSWRDFIAETKGQLLDRRLRPHQETLHGYALVIGIDEYPSDNGGVLASLDIRNLKHPADEARKMKSILSKSGYRVRLLVNKEATREAILNWTTEIARNSRKEKVLFYFSGHGTTYEAIRDHLAPGYRDQVESGEKGAGTLPPDTLFLIVPYQQHSPFPSQEKQTISVISFDEIIGVISTSDAPEKIFFIDACLARETRNHLYTPAPSYSYQLERQGYFFLSLSKEKNLDGEFSPLLFEALEGKADAPSKGNNDGVVTMFETINYINTRFKRTYLNFGIKENRVKYICYGSGDIPITISTPSDRPFLPREGE